MKIGDIDILSVIDGTLVSKVPATRPIPDVETYAWQEQHGIFRSDGMLAQTLGAFLVRTKDRLLLVDAGAGPELPRAYRPPVVNMEDPADPIVSFLRDQRGIPKDRVQEAVADLARIQMEHGQLPESLAALGIDPSDVTDVVFTHLHFDHIGWASIDGAAFFPNATLRCAAADADYFLPGGNDWYSCQVFRCQSARDRLGPVLDRLETWDSDCTLLPGIDIRLTPGHTPGSSVIVISSGPDRAMLLGDMVHCPLELMDDEFNLLADYDQRLADRVRTAYARELEGSQTFAAAAHFPDLRFGRLLPGNGVRHWTFDVRQ
jgi:glyoxylase-like metal-dependent hydrolase (beta-lactamase superfamily II)